MTSKNIYVGTALVVCPVGTCRVTKRFTETEQTLSNEEHTRELRENYLREQHLSGQHHDWR